VGVAKAEAGAQGVAVTVEGARGLTERERLRERCYELGLRPAQRANLRELRKLIKQNEHVDLTAAARRQFLDYIEQHPTCSVAEACRETRLRRQDVRVLLDSDTEFREDYRTARGYGQEQIIGQMVKLAIEGVDEPIASGGAIVGTKRVYSERLLQTMFNGLTPEGKAMLAGKLGIEISGPDGGPIEVQQGVSLESVFAFMQKHVAGELEDTVAGELVAETDEPVE
jgi:hypothetical protein